MILPWPRDDDTRAEFLACLGKPISRKDAIRMALQILERAERGRIELAEWEAERGIQYCAKNPLTRDEHIQAQLQQMKSRRKKWIT